MTPTKAAEDALRRIVKHVPKFEGALVAATKDGIYGELMRYWSLYLSQLCFCETAFESRTHLMKHVYQMNSLVEASDA